MREHTWFECKNPECMGCMWCDGGLSGCSVCGGMEGSLTTECCGRTITEEETRRIYEVGDLDFKDGKWNDGPSPMHAWKQHVRKEGE